eukprot:CAMPEP_0172553576 /NCGR_PEP_ID=MMETSP1067-20121228/51286_1 /TAXON_ID=265564 ORGANISM="Thalassiosira punctigera, Strain Tpunct2005C2" /NCGR_SAMPLE_ID=MMETSP1067 /ASSEMBLY_ACC=CAM_ASM_000444 /LENGTH=562 /DNA_ID=CAMNT_0013341787 /DNA_START=41 /DNA_END=1729 /DNA_ORIENTATION=+
MTRGMNTMPTARKGRTYYTPGPNDRGGVGGMCSVIAVAMLLVVPPFVLIASESSRHTRFVALSDALDSDIVELNRRHGHRQSEEALLGDAMRPGTLVHGTSSRIETVSTDHEMAVSIPGALTLRRNAEYCQWHESKSQRCETCTRTVDASDGSTKEERYQCNCITEYNYVKSWTNRRINSLGFDQPGAHHNPQRDPMPSATFVDDRAKLTFREGEGDSNYDDYDDRNQHQQHEGGVQASLHPDMLSNGVRGQPYRPVDFVPHGRTPPPSFFSRFFSFLGWPPRSTRYEPMQLLRRTPDSPAAIRDNFVYVGQGGYFFSPYESSTSSTLFNYFAQYLEGSLFDWQMGDLMPSCTAGDVRFHYAVQDPAVVSVLGQLRRDGREGAKITPRTMMGIGDVSAATVGLVHAGRSGARAMLLAEDSDSKNRAHVIRLVAFLWSIPASRLAGVAFERELGESSFLIQTEGTLGLFCALLGAVWLVVWGETFGAIETAMVFFLAAASGFLAYKSAARKGSGRRWNAVWCRVLKWANAPPEWRVEDSYVPAPAGGGGHKLGGSYGAGSKLS